MSDQDSCCRRTFSKTVDEETSASSVTKIESVTSEHRRATSQEIKTAVFRIVQEALTNVYRHSQAQVAQIEIKSNKTCLLLKIKDNGKGIPAKILSAANNGKTGVGLASMRERATLLGGILGVQSDSEGTTVSVSIPIPGTSRVASA